jgi:carbon monoxide dehydrogenase subunit G
MKIEERFAVPFPRERVWAFLHDTAAVARCLPGVELTETSADGRFQGRFSVKLGPIAAAFSGDAAIAFDEAAQIGEITGAGSDRKTGSRAKGSVSFALAEENDATRVDLVVDYTLAGALAQFNRGGIVHDLAGRLTVQFAENFRTALAGETPTPNAAPLDAGQILAGVVWGRLRRWLRQLFGRG